MNYKEKVIALLNSQELSKEQKEKLDNVFPELKESEDERIRKEFCKDIWTFIPNEKANKYIAWLEKQGEKTHAELGQLEATKTSDQVFKVGDWIVNNVCLPMQIASIKDGMYIFTEGDAISVSFIDENYHLWTIEDAKDGDVLACNEEILLLKSYSVQGRISLYCWYNGQTNDFHSKEVVNTSLTKGNKIYPATKEQCDTLFTKMKEAGYEWDANKKELKKMEVASKEGEDERISKEQTNLPCFTFDDVLALQCCMETVKKVQEDKELYEKLNDLHSKVYDACQLEKQGERKSTEDTKKLDADKVIAWLVANICDFEYYVNLFRKDFEL